MTNRAEQRLGAKVVHYTRRIRAQIKVCDITPS